MDIDSIFERLWTEYSGQNPSAARIHDLLSAEGEEVINDHIAFRTLDYPDMDIDRLSALFTSSGYSAAGEYYFRDKHLFARHYEHTENQSYPKVFISQLVLRDCSPYIRRTFRELMQGIDKSRLSSKEIIFQGSLFKPLSYRRYEHLRKESEYAAWFYVYGFRANHFTISINSLKKYDTIEKVNALIRDNGFILNSAGGEIKGKPEDLLRQSSTMADLVSIKFKEGIHEIPSCYYEFAQRYPGHDGRLFNGFIAGSADKIFESTNFYSGKKPDR